MAESIVGLTVRKWCSAGGFYILGYFDLKKKKHVFSLLHFFLSSSEINNGNGRNKKNPSQNRKTNMIF